jgi:NTP pyrophosphatase (non-canonical NTP hydrolase)
MSFIDLTKYINFIKDVCEKRNWKKDWSHGGCYTHLEVSEFIEAVRGKGDPLDELGDVLFTVLAVANYYGIDPVAAIELNIKKHKILLEQDNLL